MISNLTEDWYVQLKLFGDLWQRESRSTVTPGSNAMVQFERPPPTSYLSPIETFCLSRSVSELLRWPTFGDLWPRWSRSPLVPESKGIVSFDRPYPLSYLLSIDTLHLTATVSELLSLNALVTFDPANTGSTAIVLFERPYQISYLPSIDTFCLSCTVFEIIDIFVNMGNPYSGPNLGGFRGFWPPSHIC